MITNKFIIILFSLASFSIGAETSESKDPINKAIIAFQNEGKLPDLDRAIVLLDMRVKELNSIQKAEVYVSFSSEISSIFDPNFDINPPKVYLNIDPGMGYDSGVNPSGIPDTEIRKNYEQKIEENKKNIMHAAVQTAVREELEKITLACAYLLNSDQLSLTEKKKIITAITHSKLPDRFKVTALSRQEANKTQIQTGEASKPK